MTDRRLALLLLRAADELDQNNHEYQYPPYSLIDELRAAAKEIAEADEKKSRVDFKEAGRWI